ncbi:MAG: hypothetical protein WCC82_00965 [Nitrososphaeraceae archaeon]
MIDGNDNTKNYLVVSKLLGYDIEKYRSFFSFVSAAAQLSGEDKIPRAI